jgi:hypothetical protein
MGQIRKLVVQKYKYVEYAIRMGRNAKIRGDKMQTCRIFYNNGKECGNGLKKKIHTSRICYKNETQCENWAQKSELE